MIMWNTTRCGECIGCQLGEKDRIYGCTGFVERKQTLPDSGKREVMESGAVRDTQEGKGRFDLIEPEILFRLSRLYELGAIKYEPRNWEKGISVSRCLSSAMRHLIKYQAGWTDEDHLAAVIWNLGAIMRFEKDKRTDLLDMPFQTRRVNE